MPKKGVSVLGVSSVQWPRNQLSGPHLTRPQRWPRKVVTLQISSDQRTGHRQTVRVYLVLYKHYNDHLNIQFNKNLIRYYSLDIQSTLHLSDPARVEETCLYRNRKKFKAPFENYRNKTRVIRYVGIVGTKKGFRIAGCTPPPLSTLSYLLAVSPGPPPSAALS